MKKITMFHFEACPFCRRARKTIEILTRDPKYKDIKIELIDEKLNPEIADQYSYYYVPSFYVDGELIHEGAVTKKDVIKVLDAAIND